MTGAMELLLTSEQGNSSFSYYEGSGSPDLWFESIFILEPIAPAELNSDRFLPLTPLRILVNRKGEDLSREYPAEMLNPKLKEGKALQLHEQSELLNLMVPKLIQSSLQHATQVADKIRAESLSDMGKTLKKEILRLTELKKVNPGITKAEIEVLVAEEKQLREYLAHAQIRLDSVRLIIKTK